MVAPRLAIKAAEVAAVAVTIRISVWDSSTALLLLPILANTQPNHPAITSAAHLAGTKPLRAAIGTVRKVMMMTEVAARRARGGGQRPEAADVEKDEAQVRHAHGAAAASSAATSATAASEARALPMVDGVVIVGIHSAPEATWRRFQSPQPAP